MEQIIFKDDGTYGSNEYVHTKTFAFIDECGNFGFDFSEKGSSDFFVLSAILVPFDKIKILENEIEKIRVSNFQDGEMKSSQIASNHKRRLKIITEILQLDFKVIALVVDKKKLYSQSPLKNFKGTFYRYLHNILYTELYRTYPKLNIVADQLGTNKFMDSFRKYVFDSHSEINIFDEYDFEFINSKSSVIVQLADLISGTINLSYENVNFENVPKYIEILKNKIFYIVEFPRQYENYITNSSSNDKGIFNVKIAEIACRYAIDFINDYAKSIDEDEINQVLFLNYLLFELKYISDVKYITAPRIIEALALQTGKRLTLQYMYRRIIAPLRDKGVIIASCSNGYKIPTCEKDIYNYLNQSSSIITPMLSRMGKCRNSILQITDGQLDILDLTEFIKLKKYFD